MMYCEHCHAEISPSHASCPVCKKPVKAVHASCPNCSADLNPDVNCCPNCGYHLLLKKVIRLHEGADTPVQKTTIQCPACKKEIPMASRFCEYCGNDVKTVPKTETPPPTTAPIAEKKPSAGKLGFNETTFNALIKILEQKGVLSLKDLQSQIDK